MPERPERGGPCWLLKLRQMGTYRVQMKGVLPWLVRWARRTSTKDFLSCLGCTSQPSTKKPGQFRKVAQGSIIITRIIIYNFSGDFCHQHYWRAGCLSTTNSMDVQGVFPPSTVWTSRVCSSMDVQNVFPSPIVWTCRVLSTTNSMEVQGVFPPSAVWTCRVSFHHP